MKEYHDLPHYGFPSTWWAFRFFMHHYPKIRGILFYCCLSIYHKFNSLPNDKYFDWSKLKASADDKIIVIQKSKILLGRLENIVEKAENAGYQHFLLFPQCFQKPSSSG